MKKICSSLLIIFSIFFLPQIVHSQTTKTGKEVLDEMIRQFNGRQIDSASVLADASVSIQELQGNSKFWFYCGLIYKEAYKKHEKDNPQSPDREKSSQSFQKSLTLETDVDIINDIKKNLKFIASTYYNDAARLLKGGKSGIPMSIYAFNEYIELMKLADEKFDSKQKEIEYSLILGSTYATVFENDESKQGDEYYELAKKCYLKILELDPTQTSARYNIVVLETKYKTKQERLLREESQKKDLEIISLNAVKELAEVKLHESQLEEEANKKGLIIIKTQQEKYLMKMKAEQDRKDSITQEEKQKQQLILWLVVAGLFVVVVFATLVYRNSRQQAKLNIELERKNNVIEIKNKELERLSIVASETDNGVLIFDSEYKIEWLNSGLTRMTGYTLEEFKKIRGESLLVMSKNTQISKLIQQSIAERKSVQYESINKIKNGEEIWIQSNLTPIFDSDGKFKKMVVIEININERIKAEKIITEKNEELWQMSTMLRNQKEQVENQNTLIQQKNKDITDSIVYAKHIQDAILPDKKEIHHYLKDLFILYQPRDIVSGDFYWFTKTEKNSNPVYIIAAADCTGHGVPGAFMSMIGHTLLNQIVHEKKIQTPSEILTILDHLIKASLKQDHFDAASWDGMDIALCSFEFDIQSNQFISMEYAGALRSLYHVSDGVLEETLPNKFPIGGFLVEERKNFINHKINIKKGDTFYIFSDGYADQFGGNNGRKFMTRKLKNNLLAMQHLPMDEQQKELEREFREWKGKLDQVDDIMVIGIRV